MAFRIRYLAALLVAAMALGLCPGLAEGPEPYDMNAPERLLPEHLYAQSALLEDEATGEVLFSKNSRIRMYPASTTKIMTLMLALESDIALDAQVTMPAEAGDVPKGSSVIPVLPGDVMSFSDLLYGFMLSSGNDGANAIAVLVDGSIPAFVDHMNRRAAELGCEGTHYVNAHGYHDDDHYTTAQDLALIARTAMRDEDFRRIVAAPKWDMSIQRDGKGVSTQIISRNNLLISDDKYYYPDCTGIKTGHHNKAGWCFVGSAERDGKRVICVTLGCELEDQKWYDAARLFEYGFTRYEPVAVRTLLEDARESYARVDIQNADASDPQGGSLLLELNQVQGGEQTVQLVSGSQEGMSMALQRVAEGVSVQWQRDMNAPVAEGEAMGTLTLPVEGGETVRAVLVAPRSVAAQAAVTEAPTASAEPAARPEAPRPKSPGNVGLIIAALVIALVVMGCVAAAAAAANARRRRSRRRRRRKRSR